MVIHRADTIASLREKILRMEGFKSSSQSGIHVRLGPLQEAFPQATFPLGVIHEFLATTREQGAATAGFMAGLLSFVLGTQGVCLWISTQRTLFPPALKRFGLAPERFIFIDVKQERHVWWATEEALPCGALAAVVAEVGEMPFTASRRLQLRAEQSKVTGFVLQGRVRKPGPTASASRWRVTSLPSISEPGLPGIGFPCWQAELLKVRNGRPGAWPVQWTPHGFQSVEPQPLPEAEYQEKAG